MDWCSSNQEFGMGFWRRQTSYYSVLGVHKNASMGEIRSAYRKLAMQWHPDRWTRSPSSADEAKQRFQQIQEAYAVLSDERKRTMYDAGLYNPGEEEDEGFSEFVQEMLSLMSNVRKEGKIYSLEELQQMLIEMENDLNSSTQWFAGFDMGGANGVFGMAVSETSRSPMGVGRESNVAKRNTHSRKYAEIRSVCQQHGFCHLKNKK